MAIAPKRPFVVREEIIPLFQHGQSYRSDLVQSLYNSTAQCATWLFPYNTYKYPVVWSAKDSPLTSGEQFFYQVKYFVVLSEVLLVNLNF